MEWCLSTPQSDEVSCPGQSRLYSTPGDVSIPCSAVSPFRSRMLEEILGTRIMVKGSMKKHAADKVGLSPRFFKFFCVGKIHDTNKSFCSLYCSSCHKLEIDHMTPIIEREGEREGK